MRLPLASDLKTRTGAPDKDARLKNCYVESKGPTNDPNNPPQTAVRKRPIAQGGVAVGTGIAQGGYGLVVVYGDTLYPIPTGTTCNNASTYSIGDHVTINYQDFWATTNHVGNCPIGGTGNSDWSTSFVAPIPKIYATLDPLNKDPLVSLSNGNLTASTPNVDKSVKATIGKATGKWYWEIYIPNAVGLAIGYIGIGDSSALNSGAAGDTVQSMSLWLSATIPVQPQSYINGGVFTPFGAPFNATGIFIGIGLDMDLGSLSYYWNGVNQGIVINGLSGTFYPMITPRRVAMTVNFGATPFAYTVPAGYNAGLYV